MAYTMYTPLNVWLDPASVTDVVAYIQNYLSENTIYSEEEIEGLIHDYLEAHPELIGGVQSVNGKTGTVVLSASDINTANNVTIESVLASLSSQISSIAASVATNTSNITGLTGRMTTAENDLANLKSNLDTVVSPNMLMEDVQKPCEIYPPLKNGMKITASTSDGSNFVAAKLQFLDENKDVLDYYTLFGSVSYRVMEIDATLTSAKYVKVDTAQNVPIMLNRGDTVMPYSKYFPPIEERVSDLETKINTVVSDNMIGLNVTVPCPVYPPFELGEFLTVSTSDGSNFVNAQLQFLDDDYNVIDYYATLPTLSVRTVEVSTQEMVATKYIKISKAQNVPIMLNRGKVALPYSEYIPPVAKSLSDADAFIKANTLDNAWKSAVNDVQELQGKNFCFAIQTDTHFALETRQSAGGTNYPADSVNAIACLKLFTKYVGFNFIANLGDITRGYQFDTQTEMRTAMTEAIHRYVDGVCCPFMIAVGNHEDGVLWTHDATSGTGNDSIDETIQPAEQYAKLFVPAQNTTAGRLINPSKKLYYYMDFDDVRVIVLNTRDLPYNAISSSDVSINHHAISEEQVAWFSGTALNTNKQVLVLCHIPLIASLTDYVPDNADQIINAMTAFKNNDGVIIGVLCGHMHTQDSAVSDGINYIVFANGSEFAEIVYVDTTNKTISTKMVGTYGSYTNRSFTY